MTQVDKLISNLITEKLSSRFDELEKRFQREEADINALEINIDSLKKSLKECDTLNNLIIRQAEEAQAESSKIRNENSKISTSTLKREKSVDKSRDKSLNKDKSSRNINANGFHTNAPTLTKNKTQTNLKKDDMKSTMSKQKSNLNLNTDSSTPKTPKIEKRPATALQTPSKGNSSRTFTRTPTTKDLRDDNKELKRNLTTAKIKDVKKETPKESNKQIEKSSSKHALTKSGTKGTLLKENNKDKNKETKVVKKEETQQNNKTDKVVNLASHPKREENISQTIGVVNHVGDELLTKEDLNDNLIISALDKSELNPPKLDFQEILDDRWSGFAKYLNKYDHLKMLLLNKGFGRLSLTFLVGDTHKDFIENETKIKALREKYSEQELNKEQPAFAMTRGAQKAVELLNEGLYFKLFEGPVPHEDIILPYRIFFQLLNMPQAAILNQNDFWASACTFFAKEKDGKLGTMVTNLVKNIDFSDENIFKVTKIVGKNSTKITPNYFSKICGTSGLFIFLIKDALEYAGILIEKKTPPSRIIKNHLFNFQVLQSKMERLKKIQAKIFPL